MTPALALLTMLSTPAAAGDDSGLRLGLGLGWFQPGANENVIDGTWTVVPRIGWDFNRTFALEADLGYAQGTSRSTDLLFHVFDPRLNLLVHAPAVGPVTFFGAVGPGLYVKSEDHHDDDPFLDTQHDQTNASGYGLYKNPEVDLLLNVGPGALIGFGDGPLGLRTDFRYMLSTGTTPADKDGDPTTTEADVYHNWEWTIGLNVALGGGPEDSDGDGINDDTDECVDEPEDQDGFRDADGCPDKDNDNDGVADSVDECRDVAEDLDGHLDSDGCPDPDNDSDGVLDTVDECPMDAGTAATNGCPDRDGDTVVDSVDACPDEPGSPDAQGCPDRDGDRVPDARDACPDEPADARVDPEHSDGCPATVVVTDEQVVIMDKVYFDTNKATIKKRSHAILDQVASVLEQYPDISGIEVAGHTDSDGSDAYNLDLSQRRAQAVVAYLVNKGIDASRLTAKGYGESRPLNTGDKADDRRVEFNILEQ